MPTTDVETLQVALTADLKRFEQSMLRMTAVTESRTRTVENRVNKMAGNLRTSSTSAAKAMEPIAGQTGNIAAQFQDIAVQLQGGQSPFLIAMQQGTQLSSVLNQSANPVKALGAAFLQLVNPISLATIAAIALGGAAIQWLTRTQDKVDGTKDSFDAHVAKIKEIVRGYDEAEKAANAYIEENRKLPQEVASSDLQRQRKAAYEQLGTVIDQLKGKQAELNNNIQFFEDTQLDPAILSHFQGLAKAIEDAGLTSDSTQAEIDALLSKIRGIADTSADDDLRSITDEMEALLVRASETRVEVGSLGVALDKLPRNVEIRLNLATNAQSALQQLKDLAPELRDASTVAREEAKSLAERASLGAQSIAEGMAIAAQLEQTLAAIDESDRRAKDKAGQGARNQAASAAEAERKAVIDLIAQLQFEQSLLGMTEQQKQVANTLRQAGAAATEEQRQAIAQLVNTTYAEQQAIDQTTESMRQFANTAQQGLQTFLKDITSGKDATEALGNALARIGDNLLNAGLTAPLSGGAGTIDLGTAA